MSYFYIKALHITFVVTWFAGLFYIVRLFIYHTEALEKPSPEKEILVKDKDPMYEVDDFEGVLYFKAKGNTIHAYNLKD